MCVCFELQVLGYLASVMSFKHKLVTVSGGGVDDSLPQGLEHFFKGMMENATLEYDISDLDRMRQECCNALKLGKPKHEQVQGHWSFGMLLNQLILYQPYVLCACRLLLNGGH
jgi:hypothetical protein